MKFSQIGYGNDLTAKMIPIILANSPLLANYVEFFQKPGSAVSFRKQGKSDDISAKTRMLGEEYTQTTFTPDYGTANRKFIGDTVQIDVALERMGYDLSSEFLSNLNRHMKSFPGHFHYQLINGDPNTDAKQFAGFKQLVADNRTITAAENGLELVQGNDNTAKKKQQQFLEKLDELIATCYGNNKVIILNAKVLARINSVAREYLTIVKNEFGVPITHYNHIPLMELGDYQLTKDTYGPIINFDETEGTAADKCASIYCVSFEEEDGMSFATTDGGFAVYDLKQTDNWWKSRYELIADSALIRENALARLKGLYL